jgi:hypothetical protein
LEQEDAKYSQSHDRWIRDNVLFPQIQTQKIRYDEELESPAVSALGVRSQKLSNALNGQSWDG